MKKITNESFKNKKWSDYHGARFAIIENAGSVWLWRTFLSLLRTETEGRGQNARPVNEVYEIYLPNYGAVEVKIPVGNQKVKPKLRTPILLKEMVLDFIPEVRTLSNGKKRVTPRFILKAHSFELKEGGN